MTPLKILQQHRDRLASHLRSLESELARLDSAIAVLSQPGGASGNAALPPTAMPPETRPPAESIPKPAGAFIPYKTPHPIVTQGRGRPLLGDSRVTEFGRVARRYRQRNGLTLADMAALFGVSGAHLSQVELGQRRLPTAWAEKLNAMLAAEVEREREKLGA